jgi:hypothetical protein
MWVFFQKDIETIQLENTDEEGLLRFLAKNKGGNRRNATGN